MIELNFTAEQEATIRQNAESLGVDVESFVSDAIEYRLQRLKRSTASYKKWKREFNAFRATLKPRNPNFDDSRDSIYD